MRYFWLLLWITSFFGYERASSYPYLSGDTWRFFADWRLSRDESFDPADVQLGDTIFVEYDMLKRFGRKYLSKIRNRFVLITPNCETGTDNPQPGKYAHLLESKNLSAWFVQNIDREPSERVIPIPIGLANQVWDHGQVSVLEPLASNATPAGSEGRDCFVYVNFSVGTNSLKRQPCLDHFLGQTGAVVKKPCSFGEYLQDLSHTLFVVSPPGNGLDCHRTWESLLMGCYPIVLSSTLNPLYEDLPVVVVSSWDEVTEEFLNQKKEEFKSGTWNYEKLYAPYWYQKVFAIQQKLRENPTFMERVHAWFRK